MAKYKSELTNRQKKKQKAIFAPKRQRGNKLLNDPTEFQIFSIIISLQLAKLYPLKCKAIHSVYFIPPKIK